MITPIINSIGNYNIKTNLKRNTTFCAKNNTQENNSNISSNIDVKISLFRDTLSGNIDDMPFELTHRNIFMDILDPFGLIRSERKKKISGQINNKDVNLNYKKRYFRSDSLQGTVGDSNVDLKISHNLLWNNYKIKGKYDGEEVNIKIRQNALGFKLKSENSDLRIKGKHLLSNDLSVNGSFNENKELLPLIIDIVNDARHARLDN